jgi:hypothetical protein
MKKKQRDADDDNDEEMDEAPKKKSKKKPSKGSNTLLLLLIGGAAAVLLLGATAGLLWVLGVFDKKPAVAQVDTKKGPVADGNKKGPPGGKGGPKGKKGPPNDQAEKPADGWTEVRSELGKFTALYPGPTEELSPGGELFVFSKMPDGETFTINYVRLSANVAAKGQKKLLEELAVQDGINGKSIEVDGLPGWEYATGDKKIERVYVGSDYLYWVRITAEKGSIDQAKADKFFKSFKPLK